uniref:Lysine-specific demethylase n=1 Tax=Strix occidentalis caurina TaxID=311401 RepID=A0A8D0EVA1_STROC
MQPGVGWDAEPGWLCQHQYLVPRPRAPRLCHRATNLSTSLPLPEYCGPAGRLNLATYLRGRRWLRPRVCVAYGECGSVEGVTAPQFPALNTTPTSTPLPTDLLLQVEADGVDAPLKERLWDAGSRPGALWHIFRAEDAGRIRDFLQKVGACEDQGQEGAAVAEPPNHYLDLSLRRRLRQECGVSAWTLLQFLGDAVLVPAGAPHQVGSSVTPSPCGQLSALTPFFAPLQLDGVIFSAVREAVGVLRGCE